MTRTSIVALAACFAWSALSAVEARAVPTTITYTGRLTDAGAPVDGPVDVVFTLFDDEVAGAELYTEQDPALVVVDGVLVAELGENALDDALLARPELWLEVTIDGTTLAPRVRWNSVPYALRAEAALIVDAADTLAGLAPTDLVTNAQLASLGLDDGLAAGIGIGIDAGAVSIVSGGVDTLQLATSAVTTAALADAAVTSAKLADGAVTTAKLALGAVGAPQLAAGAVGTAALADAVVGQSKLADGAVDGSRILDGSIGTADLAAGAVTTTELASSAISSTQLQANAVNGSKIADESVVSADIDNGSLRAEDFADDAITAAKLTGTVGLFVVTAPGCDDPVNTVTTDSTCSVSTSGCTGGERRNCAGTGCFSLGPLVCANARVGSIFP